MTLCGNPLSRSLLGAKRTWAVAPHMSALTQSGHSGRKVLAVKSCRVLAGGHRERVLRIPHSKS
jgi:hypothetical protein